MISDTILPILLGFVIGLTYEEFSNYIVYKNSIYNFTTICLQFLMICMWLYLLFIPIIIVLEMFGIS